MTKIVYNVDKQKVSKLTRMDQQLSIENNWQFIPITMFLQTRTERQVLIQIIYKYIYT